MSVSPPPAVRRTVAAALAGLSLLLGGCNTVMLNASGDIARQQGDLIITSTVLMLLIIVPVIALTLLFAWKYRAANTAADYEPDWDHSTKLELIIWGAPLLIIIALGAITWISTHKLDPFRPLSRIDDKRELPADVKPLVIQAVAMDWKWLFIYPEQNIALVNELRLPVDRPVKFEMTASTVMNSLAIPAMAGMIYAMPGMQSELNAIINKAGVYDGRSGQYSGDGFSHMTFKMHALPAAEFDQWVDGVRKAGDTLDRAGYLKLDQPSKKHPVAVYAQVEQGLFDAAVNRCVDRSKMCMGTMMAIDETGGGGKAGIAGLTRQTWRGTERTVVAGLCTPANPEGRTALVAATQPAGKL
ncbi:MAG: cytochrome o ubiquinol oxidase subunit [Pseudomonadota bacterium]